ncbi:16S rRNA (guanine(966)-N(2))-methyltransferase RsmD [Devriesea agamarum]|uniref:16S rRNA (guanine(966)-N(2))-methyltransferase RsmD n=1 Tax=Devriesea agamarum TaxID=472569 RepID=UPI00071C7C70|nr:16S rRNA (guanine(966)-N(2))-methyltransferase RsmD [Devriesea agamarum]
MPRIIAGDLGGRTIPAPRGDRTRPTSDRVREAIFSRLDGYGVIDEAQVLDLFAGTGALGLEALSRGARSAVFVEAHQATARNIARTCQTLGLTECTEVITARAKSSLSALGVSGPFDLVLIDPPYDVPTAEVEDLCRALIDERLLADEATVVIERSSRTPPITWPKGCAEDMTRTYGETTVFYASVLDSVEG